MIDERDPASASPEALALHPAPFAPDADGRSQLHWCAAAGRAACVTWLLEQPAALVQAAVNAVDEGGYTPLHCAAGAGHAAVVSALIAAGADAGRKTGTGCLALHLHKGRAAVIEALAAATGDIDARDSVGATALHRAAAPGHLEAARALIAAGARVDAVDGEGCTPLHLAAAEGREGVALMLLQEEGASASARNKAGETPGDVAPHGTLRVTLRAAAAALTA